jgi:hypothetical protein
MRLVLTLFADISGWTKDLRKGASGMIRKSSLLAMSLVFSLLPLLGPPTRVGSAQNSPRRGNTVKKMAEAMLARSRQSRSSSEKARVIFNLADSASVDETRLKLQSGGAEISKQVGRVKCRCRKCAGRNA